MSKEHVSFLDAVRMFGQFGELGSLADDIGELVDFLERESVAFKVVRPGLMLVWMDTMLNGKEDVYSIRYNFVERDGKYEWINPYLVLNCTAYKEWRKEHGVRQKYF